MPASVGVSNWFAIIHFIFVKNLVAILWDKYVILLFDLPPLQKSRICPISVILNSLVIAFWNHRTSLWIVTYENHIIHVEAQDHYISISHLSLCIRHAHKDILWSSSSESRHRFLCSRLAVLAWVRKVPSLICSLYALLLSSHIFPTVLQTPLLLGSDLEMQTLYPFDIYPICFGLQVQSSLIRFL